MKKMEGSHVSHVVITQEVWEGIFQGGDTDRRKSDRICEVVIGSTGRVTGGWAGRRVGGGGGL